MGAAHGADRIGPQPTLNPSYRTNYAEFLPGGIGRQWDRHRYGSAVFLSRPFGAGVPCTAMPESPVWAVEPGLDNLPDGELDDDEQSHRPEQHGPPGIDGERDDHRKRGGDNRADIGHQPQQHPENAPEYRMG